MCAAKNPEPKPLFLANIGQLVTLASAVAGPRRGRQLGELNLIRDAAVLCVAGKIVSAGTTNAALRDPWIRKNRKLLAEIDCKNQVVLPGFVDSHTHPAFMAPRLVDFEQRIAGASYEEIAEAGGGISSSLQAVREAPAKALAQHIVNAFSAMAAHGTTTVEAKSGYGLTADSELKSLQAIRSAAKNWPGTVITTLLGAHVVPQEFKQSPAKYVDVVCNEMIPVAARRKLAQFVDVFCDKGAFTLADTETIFRAARQNHLDTRAHLGQLTETKLSSLLAFEPASFDHLDHVSDDDVRDLAKTDTVASLVPGANYFLGLSQFAPARKLIDAGAAVALATDYNPGSSPTLSMQFVLSLACTHMKMSPAEAIAAATFNGAWALRLATHKGSIEPGKDADMAIFDVRDYREIAYWFGSNQCTQTILHGIPIQPKTKEKQNIET